MGPNAPAGWRRKGYAQRVILLSPPVPFEVAFVRALPHGIAAGLHLPPSPDPVPSGILERLLPEERTHAETLGGYRQVQFVGGRLAMGLLFHELGFRRVPVLPDEHGAPRLSSGLLGSITHKQDLVVALIARGRGGVGVDLEETERDRMNIAPRVLRPEELAAVEQLPPSRRWCDTVIRFSVKEAIYKALHPFLKRYIGFGEVAVWPSPEGMDRVEPFLGPEEGPFQFEARHEWVGNRILATVRVRR